MSTALSGPVIQALVEPTCGALLLAMGLSSILFGVTLLQTYQYYDRYWNDSIYMKVFVRFWWYLIPNYGNLISLEQIPVPLGIAVAFLAHGFFVMRVWLTSGRKRLIPCAIIALSLGEFGKTTQASSASECTDALPSHWDFLRDSLIPLLQDYNVKAQQTHLASDLPKLT
ncbi:hypothetical protein OBBRIDRAFT_826909, partial [Obba rivulosa]